MCTGEDCDNKDNQKQGIERRSFLGAATAAVVGVTLRPEQLLRAELLPQQPQPPTNALNDPTIIQDMVSFKSGPDIIQGYVARPRRGGRFRAVVVLHGNLHLPEDHRYTAAQLAQVGLVGLAVKRFSRTPELTTADLNRSDREDRRYLSNTLQSARTARCWGSNQLSQSTVIR